MALGHDFAEAIVRDLMDIEAARQTVPLTSLPTLAERLHVWTHKSRQHRFSAEYRHFIGEITAE